MATASDILSALAKLPSTVAGGPYSTNGENSADINIMKTSTGAYWWKADMDIDTDGQPFPEQDHNSDRQTDTSFHQTDGKPLNSGKLPFIVIPLPSSRFRYPDHGIRGGDSCVVVYNGKYVCAVFGDEGPTNIIGEASYAAAKALGVQGIPYGGVDSKSVTYIVFPGSKVSPIESVSAGVAKGEANIAALIAAAGGAVTPPGGGQEVATAVDKMIAEAVKTLGLGEPNYIQDWYDDNFGDLGYNWAWCDAAVTYWAHKSGNAKAVTLSDNGHFAYTVAHAQAFKDAGQWHTDVAGIQRGDIVFFDWDGSNNISAIDHVGVVESVSGSTVNTIEGNINNRCERRQRGAAEIVGYGRPKYATTGTTTPPPSTGGKPKIKLSDAIAKTDAATRVIQTALNAEYGGVVVDGDYGPQTTAAYTRWQQSLGWPGDGVPGAHSLSELGKKRGFDVDLGGVVAVPPGGTPTTPPPVVDPPPVTPPPTTGDTLRAAGAAKGITMGAAVADSLLGYDKAASVLKAEYGSVTPENVMKWGNIHPQRDTFNWTAADRLVAFAQANGQKVHGHTLLWHTEMPSWAGPDDLDKHIRTIVGRYKGKVQSWDVVNEVMGDDGKLRSVWYKDLIGQAFRIAHEADPDAILYLNDYNIEDGRPKSDAVYELVKGLLAQGVPIHGVGFQCHFNTDWTPSAALTTQMKRFAALGLRVSVTEFDCAIKGSGTEATQATHYSNMIKAALAVGPKFDKFTTWGFTDASTWLSGQKPLPFNSAYGKKPAYTAMLTALKGSTTTPPPVVDPPPVTPPPVTPPPTTPPPVAKSVIFEDCGPGGTVAANKVVQDALNKEFGGVVIDGDWGPQTTAAYTRWQQSLGFTGSDADGVPGITSLTRLAAKYGFNVTRKPGGTPTTPPPSSTEANYQTLPEPAHNYTRLKYGGKTVNQRTADMLALAAKWAGVTIRLTQGSYNAGGVAASAGTHDGGGAGDIDVSSWSAATAARVVQCLRKAGFAAWYRTPDQGFDYHIHFEAIGDREMSSSGKAQVQDYFNGDNGLVGNARTEGETHWPNWADKYNK